MGMTGNIKTVCPKCFEDVLRWEDDMWECLNCWHKSTELKFVNVDFNAHKARLKPNKKVLKEDKPIDINSEYHRMQNFDQFIRSISNDRTKSIGTLGRS